MIRLKEIIGLLPAILIVQTCMAQFDARKGSYPSVNKYMKDKIGFDKGKDTQEAYQQHETITIAQHPGASTQEHADNIDKVQDVQNETALEEDMKKFDGEQIDDFREAMQAYLEEEMNLPSKIRHRGSSQFDSRIELRALNPLIKAELQILDNARSVGLIILKENLHAVTDSFYRINTSLTLGSKYGLCKGQAFAQQSVAGEGTAFLINGNRPQIMTANHVFTEPIDHYAIVFGYEVLNKTGGAYETLIPITDIYYLTEILYKDEQLDVAIAALNKPTDRLPLPFSTSAPAKELDVYMIGYPCGLPAKVAMNAGVKENNHPQYFYTSLDAFQGNSGSPVFDMNTHEIIGILVSGEVDFVWNGSCNTVTSCRIPYCKGEKAIRIQTVQQARE